VGAALWYNGRSSRPRRDDLPASSAFLPRRGGARATAPDDERGEPEGRSDALRESTVDSRDYEMMVVVAPTVGDEGLSEVIERVKGYVTAQGGDVSSETHENPWGRRRLAYQIDDHRDAFYVLYRFLAPPASVVEIEREIKLDEQVIRYLVVRYDEMAEHEERPPRERGGDGQGTVPFRRTPSTAQTSDRPAEPAAEAEAPADQGATAAEEPEEPSEPAVEDEG
jgi:small subunit ribosomal protein S6